MKKSIFNRIGALFVAATMALAATFALPEMASAAGANYVERISHQISSSSWTPALTIVVNNEVTGVYQVGDAGLTHRILHNQVLAANWAAGVTGVRMDAMLRPMGGNGFGPDGISGTADDVDGGGAGGW